MPWRDTFSMRPLDFQRLERPYPAGTNATEFDALRALGIEIPGWETLEREIMNDLVEASLYGIGWWAPEPCTKRRILISDQLCACAISVPQNMTDAGLHWFEFQDASERNRRRALDRVQVVEGVPQPSPVGNASEQLVPGRVRIHRVGLVRALASALDCLAGVIIGVAALPVKILFADFRRTSEALKGRELTSVQKKVRR